MKKFLKPTKFKIITCLIGGLIHPVSFFVLQYIEPSGYIEGTIFAVVFLFYYIVSAIPTFLISLTQSVITLFSQPELVANNEEADMIFIFIYAGLITIFNLIFFYVIACLIERRKDLVNK
ncbi:MAG: hypothetical protein US30_C0011G0026 [Candidatus Moranbacteria bacterium GW2011_GWF2_36_839]|nr:MAG: hypothetical protein US27_C0011G0019 [Candidatus Moranbacteria bacterium GW2011_GWF1_36_78]KKQ16795.1 MAG: hypothetical protein US30_C0011G0026 [Candidatus Moranbacteria bacterium GW2011_GWF2_36_839]HAT73600.1 hypothetical protein [Candidatus Moranbacteria bacterium]HBY10589.1 hypothetical protein [Candidatus Moranbacteria bacterium]